MPPTTSSDVHPLSAANRLPASASLTPTASAPSRRLWLSVVLFALLACQAGLLVGGNATRFGAGLPADRWSLALTALCVLLALGAGGETRRHLRALSGAPR